MAQKASGSLTITNITDGANANIWTTSTAPTTPNYTFTISNLTGADDNPRVGDIILQGVYRYTITSIGSTTVLAGSRQSLQGATGAAGGKWYSGTGITGTNTIAQIFSDSGVSSAVVGDMYLNTSTDNVYQCITAGNASTATWKYVGNIKGSTGSQGRSVTSVVTEYYRKLSGGSAPTSSTTGSTTIPDYVDGCTYYTRTITNFDSGNPDKSEWVANSGLTNEIKNAYDAWVAAGAAELKVAKIIENSEGMIVTSGINGGAVTPGTASTYGYNTIMAPNYLGLRYNAINLAKLTTTESTPALEFYIPSVNSGGTPVQGNKGLSISATALEFYTPPSIDGSGMIVTQGKKVMALGSSSLTFYDPTNGTTEQATLSSAGLKLLKGGLEAGTKDTANYIYVWSNDDATNHELTINNHEASDWRIVAGNKFGVDKAGNLYASGANIQGQFIATAGSNVYTKEETDNTYETKVNADAIRTRLTTTETQIAQNTSDITLRATKTEVENAVNNIEGLNINTETSGSNLVFTAVVIRGGNDITDTTLNEDFEWFYRTPTGDEPINKIGKTITVPQSSQTYGRTIACMWTRRQYVNLLTKTGDKLCTSTGAYLLGRIEY